MSPASPARAGYRRLRSALYRVLAPLLSGALGLLPWSGAQATGRALGRLGWRLARRDRERTLAHLALAFPELDDDEKRRLGRDSFLSHGMNLAEVLHLLHRDLATAAGHATVEGWEHVEAAGDRPTLVFTGHCGNWELLSPVFASRGRPLAAVVRPLDDAWAEAVATRVRRRFGTKVIRRGTPNSVRDLLGVVRRGGALVMLIDQDVRVDSVWVPFFGHLARTPAGPAEIALRRRMVALPAFCFRRPDGSHRVRFHRPLDLPQDVTEATALMTRAVEEQVRRHPEQWVWMHRRWRHRPPEEADREADVGSEGSVGGSRPAGKISAGRAPGR